jgi:hypothetical protein
MSGEAMASPMFAFGGPEGAASGAVVRALKEEVPSGAMSLVALTPTGCSESGFEEVVGQLETGKKDDLIGGERLPEIQDETEAFVCHGTESGADVSEDVLFYRSDPQRLVLYFNAFDDFPMPLATE